MTIPMIRDQRLPDPTTASSRIYGDKRPKVKPPFRAKVQVERLVAGLWKYRVVSNRTSSRWWLIVLMGRSTIGGEEEWIVDYATTTSKARAEGWVAAINEWVAT